MAKVLKIAAVLVSLAAAIPTGGGTLIIGGIAIQTTGSSLLAATLGVSQAVAGGIAVGVGLASSLVSSSRPSGEGNPTQWLLDPDAYAPIWFGRTACGGVIRYRKSHGNDNKYRTLVTVYSGCGPIEGFEATLGDKEETTFDVSGEATTGRFYGRWWQATQVGACPESAELSNGIGTPPDWGISNKLSGYAAAIDTFQWDAKGESTVTSNPAILRVGDGVKVYDPRLDSTYPGGSGSCRIDDQTTWVYSGGANPPGRNGFIQALTFAIAWRQGSNAVRVGGVGMPFDTIDIASFVECANLADANGWISGGAGYTTGSDKWTVLKALCQAGGGEPVRHGAVLSCIVNSPKVAVATYTKEDLVAAGSITTAQRKPNRINGVIARYRSEDHGWEVVPAGVVRNTDYVTEDGGARTREVEFPMVQCFAGETPDQAAQLAAYEIANAREMTANLPSKLKWIGYRTGDCIEFEDTPEFGHLGGKKALIMRRGLDPASCIVPLTIRTETDAKHTWALSLTGTAAPTTNVSPPPTATVPDAGDWSLAGTTIDGDGSSIPALVFTGAYPDEQASSIRFAYYQGTAAPGSETDWIAAGTLPPEGERLEVTSVGAGLSYVGSVQYVYGVGVSARLVLGPVTTGDAVTGGSPMVTFNDEPVTFNGELVTFGG